MIEGPEWFILLAVVLLLFGGSQVPKLARNLGRAQAEFKRGLAQGRDDTPADGDAVGERDERLDRSSPPT